MFLRSTDPRYDSRLLRASEILSSNDFRISGVFWTRTGEEDISLQDFRDFSNFAKVAKFGSGVKNVHNQCLWQLFLAKRIWGSPAGVIYACDLDTFLVALCLKPLKGYKVVFDQFDPYESRFKIKAICFFIRQIEKLFVQFADVYVIPKNERAMRKHHRTVVVPNMPIVSKTESVENFTSPYLFYGGILNSDRGLFTAIEVIRKRINWVFVIAGFGELENKIKELTLPNVVFLGKRSPSQIMALSASSSVILGTYDSSVSNNRNSASNKVAEAALLHVPIVISAGSGQEAEVKKFHLGFVVNYGIQEDLDKVLQSLEDTPWEPNGYLSESYLSRFRWLESSAHLSHAVREVLLNEKN